MMGSRGAKGANEMMCLSHNCQRTTKLSRSEIRGAKRSFARRTRKEARTAAVKEAAE
jgi:hypothetical protein